MLLPDVVVDSELPLEESDDAGVLGGVDEWPFRCTGDAAGTSSSSVDGHDPVDVVDTAEEASCGAVALGGTSESGTRGMPPRKKLRVRVYGAERRLVDGLRAYQRGRQ